MNRSHRKPWSTTEKALIVLTTIPFLIAGLLYLRYSWVNRPPENPAVVPPAPSPNSYDYYSQAMAKYRAPSPPVLVLPGASNAFNPLGTPRTLAVDICFQSDLWDWPMGTQPRELSPAYSQLYPASRKAAYLARNATCLAISRAGSAFPFQEPRLSLTGESHYFQFHPGIECHLFATEARYFAQLGQWDRGAESLMDLDEIGLNQCSGGTEYRWSDACYLRLRAMEELCLFEEHVSLGECRRLLKDLQGRNPVEASAASALERTETWRLDQLNRAMAENGVPEMLKTEYRLEESKSDPHFNWADKRAVYLSAKNYMDGQIANVKRPYSRWRARTSFDRKLEKSPLHDFVDLQVPFIQKFGDSRDSRYALLISMLGLRLCKADTGHYPATLNALVPKYLLSVPLDADNGLKPLVYSPAPNQYNWKVSPPVPVPFNSLYRIRKDPGTWDKVLAPYTLYGVDEDGFDQDGHYGSDLVATQLGLSPHQGVRDIDGS